MSATAVNTTERKRVVVIGAGPAGLTAALELLRRSDVLPILCETGDAIGGIARTEVYKGNRIDLGGHRFFSKSDRVMAWWETILPLEAPARADWAAEHGANLAPPPDAPDPERNDRVLLRRQRRSRILFLGKLFAYPVTLSARTLHNLGLRRVVRILVSYLCSRLCPVRPERTLEDFFVNRFGRELYATFFRDYSEKVWGVPCRELPAEWGAQRVKGLSVAKTLAHALGKVWQQREKPGQKGTETSLIEEFLYPKIGPGQLWEAVAEEIRELGGELRLHSRVTAVHCRDGRVTGVTLCDPRSGETAFLAGDAVFSSMPVKELLLGLDPPVETRLRDVAAGLVYRDFITVGLLLSGMKGEAGREGRLPDNWIYVQEPQVRLGRIQIFNNWSPSLVADPDRTWLGLEYFCSEGDVLWSQSDAEILALAAAELTTIGFIDPEQVLDGIVLRVPKAYPAYFGSYPEFALLRAHLDRLPNLYPIGRNGMHRYNNMDHSMLAAMTAVDLYLAGDPKRDRLWSVNAESDYHELKAD